MRGPPPSSSRRPRRTRSEVWVEKDGQRVNGKSIMGLLMLACPLGTKLTVRVDGPDEQEAFDDVGRLIEDGFGET